MESATVSAQASGLKPKDLCGIPWRVAFALQDDGWYLRQDIIWAKPNPMPESVRDRCTKAHEYVFLLSKSPRYYFDADAIREDAEYGRRSAFRSTSYENDMAHANGATRRDPVTVGGADPSAGRNKRSVWTVATDPFPAAHFATFPPALIAPMILAGAPAGEIVLDPFVGSGTTAIEAKRLGRRAIGIDLNAEYLDMAVRGLQLNRRPSAAKAVSTGQSSMFSETQ